MSQKQLDRRLAPARLAVLALFFVNGAVFACWAANIPFVRERFALTDGELGLVLLAIAAGAVAALLLSGRLISRFGSRDVLFTATIAYIFCLSILLFVPYLPLLVAALVAFGASNGAMDVAMNAHGVEVESRIGRPNMSTFHALYSTGGLAGAGVGGVALGAGIAPQLFMVSAAAVLLAVGLVAMPRLLPSHIDQSIDEDAPLIVLPSGPLLGLAFLACLSFISEGAMADWTAVYLQGTLGTSAGLAAAGFASFSLAMAMGRFTGDAIRSRFHAVGLLRISGMVAAVGLGIGLAAGHPIAAIVGFACVGFGLSNVVPVLFSAAGATEGVPTGSAIAAVGTAGYGGFLAGPPVIGMIAQSTSLTLALLIVVLFAAMIALFATIVRRADRATSA